MIKSALATALLTASLGSVSLPASAQPYGVTIDVAPPAPRFERAPAARRGYVWVPGYWNWNGHRYVWVKGRHVHARHGSYWVPNRWVEHDGRWHMNRGHWAANDHRERHDHDRFDHRG